MSLSDYAKILGRRGGLERAKRLSAKKRKAIALMGGQARSEAFQITKRIEENFRYLNTIREMTKEPIICSSSKVSSKLPGIYG